MWTMVPLLGHVLTNSLFSVAKFHMWLLLLCLIGNSKLNENRTGTCGKKLGSICLTTFL